jgi:hypothetical protein
LQIDLSDSFRRSVRKFPKTRRREVARTIDALRNAFGSHTFILVREFAASISIISSVESDLTFALFSSRNAVG